MASAAMFQDFGFPQHSLTMPWLPRTLADTNPLPTANLATQAYDPTVVTVDALLQLRREVQRNQETVAAALTEISQTVSVLATKLAEIQVGVMADLSSMDDRLSNILQGTAAEILAGFLPRESAVPEPGESPTTEESMSQVATSQPQLPGMVVPSGHLLPQPADQAPVSGLREAEPGLLLGQVEILGVAHHAEFIRVSDERGLQVAWWPRTAGERNNNRARLDAMQAYYQGQYQTVQIPGYRGDWVCHIFPHCR